MQSHKDYEVCISDDCSTDGRQAELLSFLEAQRFPFVYRIQPRNVRYDGNLRAAIGLARGRYSVLLGNDDALNGPEALASLKGAMDDHGPAGVVVPDFEDFATGGRAWRIRHTRNCGSGPQVAAAHFRNFSFVSGVVVETAQAQAVATERCDGSEMYQTFIGCRLIASGLRLLELGRVLVRKDIRFAEEVVDSYAARPRVWPCPIVERPIPLRLLGRVVADAVSPYVRPTKRQELYEKIILQLLLFTYPFWILEYRRVQSWPYALGVCLGMRPPVLTEGLGLSRTRLLRLKALYGLVTACGLGIPLGLFRSLQGPLYRLAKACH
jgi:glycosyltransferase involved in cell wall biosynthesis